MGCLSPRPEDRPTMSSVYSRMLTAAAGVPRAPSVQWQWQADDGGWSSYTPENSDALEAGALRAVRDRGFCVVSSRQWSSHCGQSYLQSCPPLQAALSTEDGTCNVRDGPFRWQVDTVKMTQTTRKDRTTHLRNVRRKRVSSAAPSRRGSSAPGSTAAAAASPFPTQVRY